MFNQNLWYEIEKILFLDYFGGGRLSFFSVWYTSPPSLQHLAFCPHVTFGNAPNNWHIISGLHRLCQHMALFLTGAPFWQMGYGRYCFGGPVFHGSNEPCSIDPSLLNWQNCIFAYYIHIYLSIYIDKIWCVMIQVSVQLRMYIGIEHKYNKFDKLHGCSKCLPLWIDWK